MDAIAMVQWAKEQSGDVVALALTSWFVRYVCH